MWMNIEQLELFANKFCDADDEQNEQCSPDSEEEVTLVQKKPKKLEKEIMPTQETGYLNCSKCNLINIYELPQDDWICSSCKSFENWGRK